MGLDNYSKGRQMRWVEKQGFTGKKFKLFVEGLGRKWPKGSQVNPITQTSAPVSEGPEYPSELELKLFILSCLFLNFPSLFPIDFFSKPHMGSFFKFVL